MKKKNVLKVCALGLCAVTIFAGNTIKKYKTQDKVLSVENVVYKSSNVTDKKVVDVNLTGSGNTEAYIYGVNKNGEKVWDKGLTIKQRYDKDYWSVEGFLGSKYYYLQYNGRLYVIDIQTGKEISSSYNGLHHIPEGVGYSIKYIEAGNKLFEIYGLGDKINNIAVYDLDKGSILKTAKNIDEKYLEQSQILDRDSIRYENGMIVVEIKSKYSVYNDDAIYKKFLRINVNNYKIYTNAIDKKVIDIKLSGCGNAEVDLYGLNKNKELVWFKMLHKDNEYGVVGTLGTNYYYVYNNYKLSAVDIQKGQIAWTTNVPYPSNIEFGDKLVSIDVDNAGIYIYDVKTGKQVKSIKNVIEKYVGKTNKEAIIYSDSHYKKDGILYIEVDSLKPSNTGTGYSFDHMIGYLKIDINNYKISFISDERNEIGIWK